MNMKRHQITGRAAKLYQGGFSLIELMAAIAILMVIVILMGMIFAASNDSWRMGSDKAENNALGRGAINKMADDLQYAVADDILTFVIRSDSEGLRPYGAVADEICFVSLVNSEPTGKRTAREIFYHLRESDSFPHTYDLVIEVNDEELVTKPEQHCYSDRQWYELRPEKEQFIAENVASLTFYAAYTNNTGETVYTREYYSSGDSDELHTDKLPLYVDIYLEVLDGTAARNLARRIKTGAVSERDEWTKLFVERNLKRYTKRVYFHNRDGYRIRTQGGAE